MPEAIRTAVFPVAGLGTRFLPATKAVPKEMLPVVDRQFELEATLRERGKQDELKKLELDKPPPGASSFTRQQIPAGLGHAVWCAREIVGHQPFAVLLPDMLMQSTPGCLTEMTAAYNEIGGNLLSLSECPADRTDQYGIVQLGAAEGPAFHITGMVEKPKPSEAPSNLYINGRYIFQPELFGHLGKQETGAGGEIQLTDAIRRLAETQPIYGLRYGGRTFDCGSKAGFLAANYAFAIERPDIADEFRAELKKLG